MDRQKLHNFFPFLTYSGNELLIYLDSAATTQKPKKVIRAISQFYEEGNASVHRGVHSMMEKTTEAYEQVREKVAYFIGARESSEIVFTKGTTEGINLLAHSMPFITETKNQIVISAAEHHANFLPWQQLAQKHNAQLVIIPLNSSNYMLENAEQYINNSTALVAVTLSSNVVGPVWKNGLDDVRNLIKKAHQVGAPVLLDAAQYIAHSPLNVQDLDADFVVFSGHKMMGPTGVGVLYVNKKYHDKINPYQLGGSMVHEANFNQSSWKEMPYRLEAGTPPIASVIGLGSAIDFIEEHVNFNELKNHEALLCSRFIDGLKKIENVRIIGNEDRLKKNGHLVTFVVEGVHVHDLAALIGEQGVMMRAGHLCAQPLMNFLNLHAAIRASFYIYNTLDDVDRAIEILNNAIQKIRTIK